ncbi:MAG: endonuclease/exonuclease/phosphatase family protein [Clostridia bacterium]|nr:endonuclease/exonuclease/phosphatase family protein [Clostridia bacterium]
MGKFKRLITVLCVVVMTFQVLSIPAFAADETESIQTIYATSTQQRRMWAQTSYNTNDWVYEPWAVTYWGRVHYLRFASNDVDTAKIKKATIKLDARARETEKTVYLVALSLSDTMSKKVETNLTSLSSTNIVTATGKADKLMLDKSGNYVSGVKSSVVAYTKATASDTTTDENSYSNTAGTFIFNYPMEIELDVTDTVRTAFGKGNHVQFVLTAAKDILTDDGRNLYDMENFNSFSNGVIYDSSGNVIEEVDSTLNLDTSTTVCGKAGYYTSIEMNDEYFSWLYMVRDSIRLEIEYTTEEDIFDEFASGVKSAEDFDANIDDISHLLDENAWALYTKLRGDKSVCDLLYNAMTDSDSFVEFKAAFSQILDKIYWQGFSYKISVKEELGGSRGIITTEGKDGISQHLYALIKGYNASGNLIKDFTVNVKDGRGYYNIYEENSDITDLEICLTSDIEGTTKISQTVEVSVKKLNIPSIFITELSNEHSRTYYPDNGSTNTGSTEQPFQYIELYNYGNTAVNLEDYTFVYNDGSDHEFGWIWENGVDKTLNPGELFIIGVYSTDTVTTRGLTYDTADGLSEYWEGFNTFYGVDIPQNNRVLIACVESGDATAKLGGIDHLERSFDAGVTVFAEIRKGDETVTKVMLPDDRPQRDYAYQFVPSTGDTKEEEFLFCTGCFPYELKDEQRFDYCEKVYFSEQEEIRVMTYNVLATNEAGATVADRFPLFIRTINDFDVDIVGMQEVNYLWVNKLKSGMPSRFSCVEGTSRYGYKYSNISSQIWDLINPIYYRNDKYNLLASGSAFMTPDGKISTAQWDSGNMKRTMTWAVLEDKETGEVISFVNTHVVRSGKKARVEQVKLLHQKGNELQQKYGGGIIVVGDHNFKENNEPYREYKNGGLVDSKYQTTNHVSHTSATSFGTSSEVYGAPIDYCFISPETFKVQKYDVFNGAYPEGAVSDHSALYVELLTKEHINEAETKVVSYDSESKSATIEFDKKENVVVIFADYENDKLVKVDVVEASASCEGYDVIKQNNTKITLDKNDKIFIWNKVDGLKPIAMPYIIQ